MPPRARRGFTLVELLVVIAVIGILAAIFVPVVQSARASSKRVACLSNLQQLAKAVQMYVNDHQGQYFTCASRPTLEPGLPRLCDVLTQYAPDARVFKCPADNQDFFTKEGSSYEWAALFNGRVQDSEFENIMGPSKTPMLYDYENFHPPKTPGYGGKNVVFFDGSAGN